LLACKHPSNNLIFNNKEAFSTVRLQKSPYEEGSMLSADSTSAHSFFMGKNPGLHTLGSVHNLVCDSGNPFHHPRNFVAPCQPGEAWASYLLDAFFTPVIRFLDSGFRAKPFPRTVISVRSHRYLTLS
jgi:hypothetical protein